MFSPEIDNAPMGVRVHTPPPPGSTSVVSSSHGSYANDLAGLEFDTEDYHATEQNEHEYIEDEPSEQESGSLGRDGQSHRTPVGSPSSQRSQAGNLSRSKPHEAPEDSIASLRGSIADLTALATALQDPSAVAAPLALLQRQLERALARANLSAGIENPPQPVNAPSERLSTAATAVNSSLAGSTRLSSSETQPSRTQIPGSSTGGVAGSSVGQRSTTASSTQHSRSLASVLEYRPEDSEPKADIPVEIETTSRGTLADSVHQFTPYYPRSRPRTGPHAQVGEHQLPSGRYEESKGSYTAEPARTSSIQPHAQGTRSKHSETAADPQRRYQTRDAIKSDAEELTNALFNFHISGLPRSPKDRSSEGAVYQTGELLAMPPGSSANAICQQRGAANSTDSKQSKVHPRDEDDATSIDLLKPFKLPKKNPAEQGPPSTAMASAQHNSEPTQPEPAAPKPEAPIHSTTPYYHRGQSNSLTVNKWLSNAAITSEQNGLTRSFSETATPHLASSAEVARPTIQVRDTPKIPETAITQQYVRQPQDTTSSIAPSTTNFPRDAIPTQGQSISPPTPTIRTHTSSYAPETTTSVVGASLLATNSSLSLRESRPSDLNARIQPLSHQQQTPAISSAYGVLSTGVAASRWSTVNQAVSIKKSGAGTGSTKPLFANYNRPRSGTGPQLPAWLVASTASQPADPGAAARAQYGVQSSRTTSGQGRENQTPAHSRTENEESTRSRKDTGDQARRRGL